VVEGEDVDEEVDQSFMKGRVNSLPIYTVEIRF
jgi:hypothetical protein